MDAQRFLLYMFLYTLSTSHSIFVASSLSLRKIHESMGRPEIIRYFDEEHHSNVPEYEISTVERHRSTDNSQLAFQLSAFQRRFHLHLTAYDHVISPNLLVETRTQSGDLTLERYTPPGMFYHGHVSGDPGSKVALRDKDGNGKLSGSIISDGYLYKVEYLHPRYTTEQTPRAHVISRRSLKDISRGTIKRFIADTVKVSHTSNYYTTTSRSRREADEALSTKYIEVMMTADNFTTSFYGNDTKDYVLGLANLAARLYQDDSLKKKVNVHYTLVKIYMIKGLEPELDVKKFNIRSAGSYMWHFSEFAKKRNPEIGKIGHWDNAILLSRRICGLGDCYLDGLAYFDIPCSPTAGVSINDAHSLGTAFSVAHELAHNLGVGHDYEGCQGGPIMAATQTLGEKAYHWSNCSVAAIEKTMRKVTCYNNKPSEKMEIPEILPGYTWDGTQQCRFMYDANHKLCWMTTDDCGTLFCTTGNHCFGRGVPPSEGTRCGFRKWCIKGKCVPDGTTDPPPIDGNWGQWTGFSPCSRTCGTGVRYMKRKCNNPPPQYGGKECEGTAIGSYRTCSRWRCRTRENLPTFRDKQCGPKTGYIKEDSPCILWCKEGGRASSSLVPVKDGTRCSGDVDNNSVCIGGKCQLVGCDKRLGSEAVRDRCRICGDDGSRCKLVKGNSTLVPTGRQGVLHIFPEGATNIKVKDVAPMISFLNLKRAADKTFSNLLFDLRRGIRVVKAAGSTIYYTFNGYDKIEEIETAGPITEALALVMDKYDDNNPGVHWHYYVPSLSSEAKATFEWSFKNWQSCSQTCAGGIQNRKVLCNRVEGEDMTPVSTKYCDYDKRPAGSMPCNTQKCPPVWQKAEWGKCSMICGTGIQSRNVTCTEKISATESKDVQEAKCGGVKPDVTQKCNELDCLPAWKSGDWSACTKSCGGGTQSRTVTCHQVKKDGSVVTSNECFAESKPSTQQSCNTEAC